MDHVVSTLFLPVEECSRRAVFLNAYPHAFLKKFASDALVLQQSFKPYADLLAKGLHDVLPVLDTGADDVEQAFVLLPKNMIEARALVAQGIKLLQPGGVIYCAADNKAGGSRIKKMLQDFGLENLEELSKNKARVVWGAVKDYNKAEVEKALEQASVQTILDGDYYSMPGIFGWDKIDAGSEILLQHLPDTIQGRGADFGCGYGYLSRHIVQHYPDVTELFCIDADERAVRMCKKNLEEFQDQCAFTFLWEDLTRVSSALKNLDFIVMNPPFHKGKKTDSEIGESFIYSAFSTLKPGGMLWMVANAHLPYEGVLHARFSRCDKLYEDAGFKVFAAQK